MSLFIDIHTHSEYIVSEKDIIKIRSINVDENVDIDALSFASVAVHPWSVVDDKFIDYQYYIEGIILKENVIAIGETGLDRVYFDTFQIQKSFFLEHVKLSEKHKMPMILHVVRAYPDIIEIRKQTKATMPWIIHGFNANEQTVEQLLRHDFYLSLGDILFKDEEKSRRLLQVIPRERLFLETDDKDISILDVYQRASFLSGRAIDDIRTDIFSNFVKIFR